MRAVSIEAPGQALLIERDVPEVHAEGWELVRVLCAGLSSGDVQLYQRRLRGASYPRVPGREVGGVLETGARAGQRVVLDPTVMIGAASLADEHAQGEVMQNLGVERDGGLCEWIAHPLERCLELPDALCDEWVPLLDPLATALHAIGRVGMTEGASIVIFGAGMVGLMAAMLALYYQAVPIVVEPLMGRLRRAKEIGVDRLIHAASDPVLEAIREHAGGLAIPSLIDTSGESMAIRQAVQAADPGARIALVGQSERDVALDASLIQQKQLEVCGASAASRHLPTAINLVASRALPVESLIGDVIAIEDAPERIARMADRPEEVLHTTVRVDLMVEKIEYGERSNTDDLVNTMLP